MIRIWYNLIRANRMSLADVPEPYRAQVEALLIPDFSIKS